ncbi:MAG: hypothetical protein BAA03_04630 [Caldibacillus debilis]|nr:MAG: hypothetical protein BAA03_04630 [Caldibacillus debilis]
MKGKMSHPQTVMPRISPAGPGGREKRSDPFGPGCPCGQRADPIGPSGGQKMEGIFPAERPRRLKFSFELIALSAITCPAKLCETCQKNFPPFFDVKIEEIML